MPAGQEGGQDVIFKKPKYRTDWQRMVTEGMMVVPPVVYAAQILEVMFRKAATVTEVHRSHSEQRALCKRLGIRPYLTVHTYWRGVDLSVKHLTAPQVATVEAMVNERFSYGRGKKVAIHHNVGAGDHIHIQAPAQFGVWRP